MRPNSCIDNVMEFSKSDVLNLRHPSNVLGTCNNIATFLELQILLDILASI